MPRVAAAAGTVSSTVQNPDCSAADTVGRCRTKKFADHVQQVAKTSALSSQRTRQKVGNQAAPTKTATEPSVRPQKKQKTASASGAIPPVPEAHKEHIHVPGVIKLPVEFHCAFVFLSKTQKHKRRMMPTVCKQQQQPHCASHS